ncbi:MAG: hypothetical protein C0423_15610 [Methylibium sp.]|nr:hypothetical protein [Methylibium sp.]
MAPEAARAAGPIDFSAYALPVSAAHPTQVLRGLISLRGTETDGGFAVVLDSHGYATAAGSRRKQLPPFAFQFVQTGSHLVPLQRGLNASSHPDWEYLLMPGRVWNEAGDAGFSRVALPFALLEKNQNCVHNGVLSFLFKSDGSISKVAYQIASETCAYFKADFWGVLEASYQPQELADAAAVAAAYQAELAARLPVKPLSALAGDHPGASINVAKLLAPYTTDAQHVTTVGFISKGIHYRGGCTTRRGEYPFCDQLVLPSYSTAKSAFAGLALMRLESRYPGTAKLKLSDLVPECAPARWGDVSIEHALDMATGNYSSAAYEADENSADMAPFFGGLTHQQKIGFACNQYSRQASPGSQWVYHTSDTYLAGTAMNAALRRREGPGRDIYTDTLVGDVWSALRLSPAARQTRRSADAVAQPFAGYGLYFTPDDVAKIGSFIGVAKGQHAGAPLLDSGMLNAALQLNPADPGLSPGKDLRYNNGFWALNVKSYIGCSADRYVPFMSGFGGITVALLPNDTVYYIFSDNHTYYWVDAVVESNKIRPVCQ